MKYDFQNPFGRSPSPAVLAVLIFVLSFLIYAFSPQGRPEFSTLIQGGEVARVALRVAQQGAFADPYQSLLDRIHRSRSSSLCAVVCTGSEAVWRRTSRRHRPVVPEPGFPLAAVGFAPCFVRRAWTWGFTRSACGGVWRSLFSPIEFSRYGNRSSPERCWLFCACLRWLTSNRRRTGSIRRYWVSCGA